MAKQVIPVEGIAEVGVIKDAPAVSLPPNAFSDARNVRFDDGAIRKMKGHEAIFAANAFTTDTHGEWQDIQHVAYWENPNKDVWVVIDRRGLLDEVWLCWFDANNVLVRSERHNTSDQAGAVWQSTIFNGGYSIVLNNGLDIPVYLSDTQNSEATITDDSFADLPNWDSYTIPAGDSQTGVSESDPTVTASIVVAFGNLLMAGGLRETKSDGTVIRDLAGVVRSSSVATLGDVPQNWNPFATGAGTADELLLADTGRITAMRELQGKMIAYTTDSIHQVDVTNQGMRTIPLTKEYGALAQDSVFEFDGRHLIVGSNDIYVFSGHPGSIESISDSRVRRYFFDNLSPVASDNIFVLRNQEYDEIWVCYPNLESRFGYCNEALIWNFRTNVWTIRDLPDVYSGVTAPLPGAGSPNATITFTGGPSGNNTAMNTGQVEKQQMEMDGQVRAPHSGLGQIQEFALPEMDYNVPHGTATNITQSSAAIITGPTAGLSIGQRINISGAPNAFYDGIYVITGLVGSDEIVTSRNTFSIGSYGTGNSSISTEGFVAAGREIISMNITGDAGPNTVSAVYTLTADDTAGDDANNLTSLFTYNQTTLNGGCLLTITDNNGTHRIPANALTGLTEGSTVSTSVFFTAVATYINDNSLPEFDWSAESNANELELTSDVVGVRSITAATMRTYTGTTQTITGSQAAANDANNLTLVRTAADPLAATAVTGGGTDADVAGIEVVVAANGTYDTIGALTETTPPITGTGSGIYTVTANTSYIIYTGFANGTVTWNGTGQNGMVNLSGENFTVAFRGPAWQTGDGAADGISASTGVLGTGLFSVGVSGHGSVSGGSLGERTVTTNTRQRITFTNPNPFAVDLLVGSTGGARTLAATGDLDGDDSFHVQNNDTTNRDWTVSSAYINDTGTGSGYAGGFGVTSTAVTLAAPVDALAVVAAPINRLTFTGAGNVDVTATYTWAPDSALHFASQVPTGLNVQFLLDGVQMGAFSGSGALNPTYFSGPTVRNSAVTIGTGAVTMRVTGTITGTTTLNFANENAGTWAVTTDNSTGNTGYDISFTNNNNVSTTISDASRAGGTIIAAGLRTFAATGGTRTRQVGNDVANNSWTIAFESTQRSTWTATNNRTAATNHVQSDVFSYMLTVDGTTYNLGDIDDNGNTASAIVVGTTATATYSAEVNGTTLQNFGPSTSSGASTNDIGGSPIDVTRTSTTTNTNLYSYDVFGSSRNTQNTGRLPNLTAFTRAANGVATFAGDVRGVLSTNAGSNVFRIGFNRGNQANGAWNTTLFTVQSITNNGRTVTVTNNTSGFPNYNTANAGFVAGLSTDVDGSHDRIWRSTYNAFHATNEASADAAYGNLGGQVTFNGQRISGGPFGGSTFTSDVLGTDWHVLTLRPGRWYRFRTYNSTRDGTTDAGWQIAGIPTATMTTENFTGANSNVITGDGAFIGFYGYVTEPTLIAISGGSENNLRAGMPGGGGPKTPFMGGWDPTNSSGLVPITTHTYAYSKNANTGPANITNINGTAVTVSVPDTGSVTNAASNNIEDDTVTISGNYTVVDATTTDLTAPTVAEDTAGVGVYGISAGDSPSIQMSWEHGISTDDDYFNISIPAFESTDDTQAELSRHVYDYLITQTQFQGLDPSVDGVVQPDGAIYYPEYDDDTNTMRFERVTTGDHPDSHVVGAFDYSTVFNGVSYEEETFGGNVTDSVTISVQGQTGNAPPVIRVADPTAGNFDVIVGGTLDRNGLATALRNSIHRSTAFQASGTNNNLILTREAVGPNTNVAVMSKHDDDDNVLPTTYGGTFAQTRAGYDPISTPAVLTVSLPSSEWDGPRTLAVQLTGTLDTTLTANDIAGLLRTAVSDENDDNSDFNWDSVSETNTPYCVFSSTENLNYYRNDNGMGTGDIRDPAVLWTWSLEDHGGSLTDGLDDPLSSTGTVNLTGENSDQIDQDGIRVRYSQPTWIRVTYNDGTSQDYLYGGTYQGALANNAVYHGNIYTEPDTQSDFRYTIDTVNLDMRNEVTEYANRRLNVISNTTNNTLRALPTQYGEFAFYFDQWDLLNPGTVAPATLAAAIPASGTDSTFNTSETIERTYDFFRPWPKNEVNKSRNFMLMSGETQIYGMDLTYGFAGQPMTSYVERESLHLQPTKDVEMLSGMYLDVESQLYGTTDLGNPNGQTFSIRAESHNNATVAVDLSSSTALSSSNRKDYTYYIGGTEADYKADIRITGRMISYRIENSSQSRWDIGGLSLEVGKGGTR